MFGGILKSEGRIGRGGAWIYDFSIEMFPVSFYDYCCCCYMSRALPLPFAIALPESLGSTHELRMTSTTVHEDPVCF